MGDSPWIFPSKHDDFHGFSHQQWVIHHGQVSVGAVHTARGADVAGATTGAVSGPGKKKKKNRFSSHFRGMFQGFSLTKTKQFALVYQVIIQ